MKQLCIALGVVVAALCIGCASNGGKSLHETTTTTPVTHPDGSLAYDSDGNPVMQSSNYVNEVKIRQNALAAASSVKDFTYGRTMSNGVLNASVGLSSASQDAKLDPEVVAAIAEGILRGLGVPASDFISKRHDLDKKGAPAPGPIEAGGDASSPAR